MTHPSKISYSDMELPNLGQPNPGAPPEAAAEKASPTSPDASGDVQEASSVDPEFGALPPRDRAKLRALTRRGIARAREGDLRGAINDYTAALTIFPRHLPALANRGVALFHAGESKAAAQDCDLALHVAPDFAKAWLVRGLARAKLGDAAGARTDLTHYRTLAPTSSYLDLVAETLETLPKP